MEGLSARERSIFNALLKKYPGAIPSPGFLRSEAELRNSNGTYTFRVDKNSGELVTELKLDRNDIFVITDLAVYLAAQDQTKMGMEVLQTYPNKTVFPAVVGPPAFEPDHLEAIYNGRLSLKIANKVNIEAMSMHNFRVVPQTQQSAATNKSQYSRNAAGYALGSIIYLKGNMDIEVKIEFNSFDNIAIQAQTANIKNKLVFHPYGFLIKGQSLQD